MPRKFRVDEISEMVSTFKRMTQVENRGIMEACKLIGEERGRTADVIYAVIRRFQPTTDAAKAFIEASALRLAIRAVRKANTDQSIDILSRSNMGVLAPNKEIGGGGGGFFLSVTTENLGAVKIGVVQGNTGVMVEGGAGSLPSAPSAAASGRVERMQMGGGLPSVIDYTPDVPAMPKPQMTDPGVPHPTQGTIRHKGVSADHQSVIASYKRKLTEARRDAQLKKNREVTQKLKNND